MKYYFTILFSVFLLGKGLASPVNKEIGKLYKEGYELINKDIAKADSLINLAWTKSIELGDSRGIADGYFYMGCLYDREMKIDTAIKYFNKANTLYHLIDNWENVPDSYGRLGLLLIKKNQPQQGLKHLLEALKLADELKNPQALIRNTIVLAMHLNDYTGQYDDAIKYLKEAERSALKLGEDPLLGHIYLQLSSSYKNKQDFVKAIEKAEQAYDAFASDSSTYNQMRALFSLANIYEKLYDREKTVETLARIRPFLKENPDDLMKANYYKLLAEYYFRKGEFTKSLNYAEYAANLLREGGQTRNVNDMDEILFRLHYILGNRKIADSLYSHFSTTRDSLFTRSSIAADAEMRGRYEAEKRNQQIEFQALALNSEKFLRRSLVGIVAFALILCFVIYGRLREKARSERLLGMKNEKIERQYTSLRQMNEYNENLLREIHHRVKNNIQIISSLFSIQARNIDHPAVINLIEKSKSRLKTISIIHNTLYTQKSLSKIKMSDFIKEIGESLFEIYNVENSSEETLQLNIKGDSVYLNADTSLPLGLIINELITNSLKYAFVERNVLVDSEESYNQNITDFESEARSHHIDISINKISSQEYALTYSDSGPGIEGGIDIQNSKSTGLRLIRGLLQQLNGSIDYTRDAESHQFTVIFKEVE